VPFELPADPGDPGHPNVRIGRLDGAEAGAERRILRDHAQVLAHGALICPECDLPLAVPGRIPAGQSLECGFCGHEGPARRYLRGDVYDTVANEAYLVARLV